MTVKSFAESNSLGVDKVLNLCKKLGIDVEKEDNILSEDDQMLLEYELEELEKANSGADVAGGGGGGGSSSSSKKKKSDSDSDGSDFHIDNPTFSAAYKCLVDAVNMLGNGLGDLSGLNQNGMDLIDNPYDGEYNFNLSSINDLSSGLQNRMTDTIIMLSRMDYKNANYFKDTLGDLLKEGKDELNDYLSSDEYKVSQKNEKELDDLFKKMKKENPNLTKDEFTEIINGWYKSVADGSFSMTSYATGMTNYDVHKAADAAKTLGIYGLTMVQDTIGKLGSYNSFNLGASKFIGSIFTQYGIAGKSDITGLSELADKCGLSDDLNIQNLIGNLDDRNKKIENMNDELDEFAVKEGFSDFKEYAEDYAKNEYDGLSYEQMNTLYGDVVGSSFAEITYNKMKYLKFQEEEYLINTGEDAVLQRLLNEACKFGSLTGYSFDEAANEYAGYYYVDNDGNKKFSFYGTPIEQDILDDSVVDVTYKELLSDSSKYKELIAQIGSSSINDCYDVLVSTKNSVSSNLNNELKNLNSKYADVVSGHNYVVSIENKLKEDVFLNNFTNMNSSDYLDNIDFKDEKELKSYVDDILSNAVIDSNMIDSTSSFERNGSIEINDEKFSVLVYAYVNGIGNFQITKNGIFTSDGVLLRCVGLDEFDDLGALTAQISVMSSNESGVTKITKDDYMSFSSDVVSSVISSIKERADNEVVNLVNVGASGGKRTVVVTEEEAKYVLNAKENGSDGIVYEKGEVYYTLSNGSRIYIESEGNVLSTTIIEEEREKKRIEEGYSVSSVDTSSVCYNTVESYNYLDGLNYVYNTSSEEDRAANLKEYLSSSQGVLDERYVNIQKEIDQNYANRNPELASIASVVMAPFEGAETFAYAFGHVFNDKTVYRSQTYSTGDTYRGQVSSNIRDSGKVGASTDAFLYDVGMSMLDNAYSAALTGGASKGVGLVLALSSFDNSYNDALDRGIGDGRAFAYAVTMAGLEAATESSSFEHLRGVLGGQQLSDGIEAVLKNKSADVNDYLFGDSVYRVLSQSVAEGTEEVVSSIGGNIIDNLINGSLSQNNIDINNKIAEGKSYEEAFTEVFLGNLKEAGVSFLSGAVSGGGMAVGGTGVSAITNPSKFEYIQNLTSGKYTGDYTPAINTLLNIENSSYSANILYAKNEIDRLYSDGYIDLESKKKLESIVTNYYAENYNGDLSEGIDTFYDTLVSVELSSRLKARNVNINGLTLEDMKEQYSYDYKVVEENLKGVKEILNAKVNDIQIELETDSLLQNIKNIDGIDLNNLSDENISMFVDEYKKIRSEYSADNEIFSYLIDSIVKNKMFGEDSERVALELLNKKSEVSSDQTVLSSLVAGIGIAGITQENLLVYMNNQGLTVNDIIKDDSLESLAEQDRNARMAQILKNYLDSLAKGAREQNNLSSEQQLRQEHFSKNNENKEDKRIIRKDSTADEKVAIFGMNEDKGSKEDDNLKINNDDSGVILEENKTTDGIKVDNIEIKSNETTKKGQNCIRSLFSPKNSDNSVKTNRLRKKLIKQVVSAYKNIDSRLARDLLRRIDMSKSEGGTGGICGYYEVAKVIFRIFDGKEKLFKQKFGFSMYLNGDFNFEQLIVDLFVNNNDEKYVNELLGGKDFKYKALCDAVTAGRCFNLKRICDYLKEKKIDISPSQFKEHQIYNSSNTDFKKMSSVDAKKVAIEIVSNVREQIKSGNQITISAMGIHSGKLEAASGKVVSDVSPLQLINVKTGKSRSFSEGHVMSVRGIDSSGRLIVYTFNDLYAINLVDVLSKGNVFSINCLEINQNVLGSEGVVEQNVSSETDTDDSLTSVDVVMSNGEEDLEYIVEAGRKFIEKYSNIDNLLDLIEQDETVLFQLRREIIESGLSLDEIFRIKSINSLRTIFDVSFLFDFNNSKTIDLLVDEKNISYLSLFSDSFLLDLCILCDSNDKIIKLLSLVSDFRFSDFVLSMNQHGILEKIISDIDDNNLILRIFSSFSNVSDNLLVSLYKNMSLKNILFVMNNKPYFKYYKNMFSKLGIDITKDDILSFINNNENAFLIVFEQLISKINDNNVIFSELVSLIVNSDVSFSSILSNDDLFDYLNNDLFYSSVVNNMDLVELINLVSKVKLISPVFTEKIVHFMSTEMLINIVNNVNDFKFNTVILYYMSDNQFNDLFINNYDMLNDNAKKLMPYFKNYNFSSMYPNYAINTTALGNVRGFATTNISVVELLDILENKYEDFINRKLDIRNYNFYKAAFHLFYQQLVSDGRMFTDISPLMIDRLKQISKQYEIEKNNVNSNYFEMRGIIQNAKFYTFVSKHGLSCDVMEGIDIESRHFKQFISNIENCLKRIPHNLSSLLNKFKIYSIEDFQNNLWRFVYDNPRHSAAMSGGDGNIYIYSDIYELISNNMYFELFKNLVHELAHSFDNNKSQHNISLSQEWIDAIKSDDNYPTEYSKVSPVEDFAESVALYFSNQTNFENKYPNRSKVIKDLFEVKDDITVVEENNDAVMSNGDEDIDTDFIELDSYYVAQRLLFTDESVNELFGSINESRYYNSEYKKEEVLFGLVKAFNKDNYFAQLFNERHECSRSFYNRYLANRNNLNSNQEILEFVKKYVQENTKPGSKTDLSQFSLFDILSPRNSNLYGVRHLRHNLIEKLSFKIDNVTQKIMHNILGYIESDIVVDYKYSILSEYIFSKYKDNTELFEKKFGFPMYIDGGLNRSMLVADMYSYMLSFKFEGKSVSEIFNSLMSNRGKLDITDELISNYLKDRRIIDKKQEFIYKSIYDFKSDFSYGMKISDSINDIVSRVSYSLSNGRSVVLSLNSDESVFVNLRLEEIDGKFVTKMYNGYSIAVVGVSTDNRLIVENSLGKFYINLKDALVFGKRFNINEVGLDFVEVENKEVQTIVSNVKVEVGNKRMSFEEFDKDFSNREISLGNSFIYGSNILDFIENENYIKRLFNTPSNHTLYIDYTAKDMIFALVKLFQELDKNGLSANDLYPHTANLYNEYKACARKGLLNNDDDIKRFASDYAEQMGYLQNLKKDFQPKGVGMKEFSEDGNIVFQITDNFYNENIELTEEATEKLDNIMHNNGSFENVLRVLKNAVIKRDFDSIPDALKQQLSGLSYNQIKTYLRSKMFDMIKDDIENFDLKSFFYEKNNVADSGAYVVITTDDMVIVPSKHRSFSYNLGDIFEYLNKDFDSSKYKNEAMMRRDTGYIVIELQNKSINGRNIIYSPDVISGNQYRMLQEFNQQIKELTSKDNLASLGFNLRGNNGSSLELINVNNIDGILSNLLKDKRVNKSDVKEIREEMAKQQEIVEEISDENKTNVEEYDDPYDRVMSNGEEDIDDGYELDDDESLGGRIGIQYFGGKNGSNSKSMNSIFGIMNKFFNKNNTDLYDMSNVEEIISSLFNIEDIRNNNNVVDIDNIKQFEYMSVDELNSILMSKRYNLSQKKAVSLVLYLKSLNLSLKTDNIDFVYNSLVYKLSDKGLSSVDKLRVFELLRTVSNEFSEFDSVDELLDYQFNIPSESEILDVKTRNSKFDLNEFYSSNEFGHDNGAVIRFTDNQVVSVLNGNNGRGAHGFANENIISAIFGIEYVYQSKSFIDPFALSSSFLSSNSRNMIDVRLVSEYGYSLYGVDFPDKISRKQFELFKAYADKYGDTLRRISEDLTANNKTNGYDGLIGFIDKHNNVDVSTHDINDLVKYAETLVDDNYRLLEDRNIVGYTLNDLRGVDVSDDVQIDEEYDDAVMSNGEDLYLLYDVESVSLLDSYVENYRGGIANALSRLKLVNFSDFRLIPTNLSSLSSSTISSYVNHLLRSIIIDQNNRFNLDEFLSINVFDNNTRMFYVITPHQELMFSSKTDFGYEISFLDVMRSLYGESLDISTEAEALELAKNMGLVVLSIDSKYNGNKDIYLPTTINSMQYKALQKFNDELSKLLLEKGRDSLLFKYHMDKKSNISGNLRNVISIYSSKIDNNRLYVEDINLYNYNLDGIHSNIVSNIFEGSIIKTNDVVSVSDEILTDDIIEELDDVVITHNRGFADAIKKLRSYVLFGSTDDFNSLIKSFSRETVKKYLLKVLRDVVVNVHNDFDLEEFYSYGLDKKSGYLVVTSKQVVMIPSEIMLNTRIHFEDICEILFENFDRSKYKDMTDLDIAKELGLVLVELHSNKSNVVYSPKTINAYQYKMLSKFNDQIKTIISNNLKFNERNIEFTLVGDNTKLFNQLDNLLEKIVIEDNEGSVSNSEVNLDLVDITNVEVNERISKVREILDSVFGRVNVELSDSVKNIIEYLKHRDSNNKLYNLFRVGYFEKVGDFKVASLMNNNSGFFLGGIVVDIYDGDLTKKIEDFFDKGMTCDQIIKELSFFEKVKFKKFLRNTEMGRYLKKLTSEELFALKLWFSSDISAINKISDDVRNIDIVGDMVVKLSDGRYILNNKYMYLSDVIANLESAIEKFGGLKEDMVLSTVVDINSFMDVNGEYYEIFEQIQDKNDPFEVLAILRNFVGVRFFDSSFVRLSNTVDNDNDKLPIEIEYIALKGTPAVYLNGFLFNRNVVSQIVDVDVVPNGNNKFGNYKGDYRIVVRCVVDVNTDNSNTKVEENDKFDDAVMSNGEEDVDDYRKVDVSSYVDIGIYNGTLVPFDAVKFGRIIARRGILGEEIITWSEDSNGNPIQEKPGIVGVDSETGEVDWIVTKVDENGNPIVDKNGHINEWIITDKNFKKKYEIDPKNNSVYRPTGGIQTFVKIDENIILNQWGSDMKIAKGGYINITNEDDMYGISERDFVDTYKVPDIEDYDDYSTSNEDDYKYQDDSDYEDEIYFQLEDKLYEHFHNGKFKINALGNSFGNIDLYSFNIETLVNILKNCYDDFINGTLDLGNVSYNAYRAAFYKLYEILESSDLSDNLLSSIVFDRLRSIAFDYEDDRARMIEEVSNINGSLTIEDYDSVVLDNGIDCLSDNRSSNLIDNIQRILNSVPSKLRNATKKITLNSNNNPGESYWRFINGTDSTVSSNKTYSDEIILYKDQIDKISSDGDERIIYRELAYNFDSSMGIISNSEEWINAMKLVGNYISDYSSNDLREDFANAISNYLLDKDSFSSESPNRTKIIEQLLNDDSIGYNGENIDVNKRRSFVNKLKSKYSKLLLHLNKDIRFNVDRRVDESIKTINGFKIFSKDLDTSIKQMSKYFGDAGISDRQFGRIINMYFIRGMTVSEIKDVLNDEQLKLFNEFLETDNGKYLSKLTSDEIMAIVMYTRTGDRAINKSLRTGNYTGTFSYTDEYTGKTKTITIEKFISDLNSALEKFGGIKEDTVIYRAVKLTTFTRYNSIFTRLFESIKNVDDCVEIYSVMRNLVGERFSDLGFMSASPAYNTSYAMYDGFPVVLEILTPKGTPGAYINQISKDYNRENEFLYMNDTSLTILDVQLLHNYGDVNGVDKVVVRCVVDDNIDIDTIDVVQEIDDAVMSNGEDSVDLDVFNGLSEKMIDGASRLFNKSVSDLTVEELERYQKVVKTADKILESVPEGFFKDDIQRDEFLYGVPGDVDTGSDFKADDLRTKFLDAINNGSLVKVIDTFTKGELDSLKVAGFYKIIYAINQFVETNGFIVEDGVLPIKQIAAKEPAYFDGAKDLVLSVLANILKQAEDNRERITGVLTEIAALNNGTLRGLDKALKSEDSASRKVYNSWLEALEDAGYTIESGKDVIDENGNIRLIVIKEFNKGQSFVLTSDGTILTSDLKNYGVDKKGNVVNISFSDFIPKDLLRYTIISDTGNYMDTLLNTIRLLEENGYEIISSNLSWPGSFYKGVNLTLREKTTSQIFELQFHTETSFYAKNEGTHDFYEVKRNKLYNDGEKSSSIQRVADYAQILVESNVEVPNGAEKLGVINKFVKYVLTSGKNIDLTKMNEIIAKVKEINSMYDSNTDAYKDAMKTLINSVSIEGEFSFGEFLSKYLNEDGVSSIDGKTGVVSLEIVSDTDDSSWIEDEDFGIEEEDGYELKDGESLASRIGTQFFGGKVDVDSFGFMRAGDLDSDESGTTDWFELAGDLDVSENDEFEKINLEDEISITSFKDSNELIDYLCKKSLSVSNVDIDKKTVGLYLEYLKLGIKVDAGYVDIFESGMCFNPFEIKNNTFDDGGSGKYLISGSVPRYTRKQLYDMQRANWDFRITLNNSSNIETSKAIKYVKALVGECQKRNIDIRMKNYWERDAIILYCHSDQLYSVVELLEDLSDVEKFGDEVSSVTKQFGPRKPFTIGLNDNSYYGISMYSCELEFGETSRLKGPYGITGDTFSGYTGKILKSAYENLLRKYNGDSSKISVDEFYDELIKFHKKYMFGYENSTENIPLWMNRRNYQELLASGVKFSASNFEGNSKAKVISNSINANPVVVDNKFSLDEKIFGRKLDRTQVGYQDAISRRDALYKELNEIDERIDNKTATEADWDRRDVVVVEYQKEYRAVKTIKQYLENKGFLVESKVLNELKPAEDLDVSDKEIIDFDISSLLEKIEQKKNDYSFNVNVADLNYRGIVRTVDKELFLFQDKIELNIIANTPQGYDNIFYLFDNSGNMIGYVRALEKGKNVLKSTQLEYEVFSEYYGKGYATQLLNFLIEDIFDNGCLNGINYSKGDVSGLSDIEEIHLSISDSNIASQKVALKNGFINNGYSSYILLKNDYLSSRSKKISHMFKDEQQKIGKFYSKDVSNITDDADSPRIEDEDFGIEEEDNDEYVLKDGEHLSGRIGMQFFGGTLNNNDSQLPLFSKLIESIGNNNLFQQVLEQIKNLKETDLIAFKTLDEYKEYIIDYFISINFDGLTPRQFWLLTTDKFMLKKLIGTEVLNKFILDYYERAYVNLAETFNLLDAKSINQIFNNPVIKDYIMGLSADVFTKSINAFCEYSNYTWLQCDTFVEKIMDMSYDELYIFMEKTNWKKEKLIKMVFDSRDYESCLKLLHFIENKCLNVEALLEHPEFRVLVSDFYPYVYGNEELLRMNNKQKHIKDEFESKIISLLNENLDDVLLSDGYRIANLDTHSVYVVKYELNGNIMQWEILTENKNYINMRYAIDKTDIYKAIVSKNFKLLSIQKDEFASKLCLSSENGLVEGINKLRLKINGIEKQILVNYSGYGDINLSDRFGNVSSIEIIDVKSVESKNVILDDGIGIYEITYIENGTLNKTYLTSTHKSLWDEDYVLKIDDYFIENNIINATDIQIRKVDMQEIDFSSLDISKYSSSYDIFTNNKYGGNQSDVRKLVIDFINGTEMNFVSSEKAKTMLNLIDKYFPNSSDIDKVNLVVAFEQVGCGYIAIANAFCTYMGSLENGFEIFKEKLGFDLYILENGRKYFNVEAVAFDILCSQFISQDIKLIINENKIEGVNGLNFVVMMKNYFNDKSIFVKASTGNYIKNKNETKINLLSGNFFPSKSSFKILSASNFDMELMSLGDNSFTSNDGSLNNTEIVGKVIEGIGGHAMIVTGVDGDGELIVSSWNKKYKFISESIDKYIRQGQKSEASVWTIEFDIGE